MHFKYEFNNSVHTKINLKGKFRFLMYIFNGHKINIVLFASQITKFGVNVDNITFFSVHILSFKYNLTEKLGIITNT